MGADISALSATSRTRGTIHFGIPMLATDSLRTSSGLYRLERVYRAQKTIPRVVQSSPAILSPKCVGNTQAFTGIRFLPSKSFAGRRPVT